MSRMYGFPSTGCLARFADWARIAPLVLVAFLSACQDSTHPPSSDTEIRSAVFYVTDLQVVQDVPVEWKWVQEPIGAADRSMLEILGKILQGPRVRNQRYGLDGFMHMPQLEESGTVLIECSLSGGGTAQLIGDSRTETWRARGELGFLLDLTPVESRILFDDGNWNSPLPDGVRSRDGRALRLPAGLSAMGPLRFEPAWGWERHSSYPQLSSAVRFQTTSSGQVAGVPLRIESATAATLLELRGILAGGRYSSLHYYPSHKVSSILSPGNPADWIDCTLADGQVVRIQIHSSGPWMVDGEGPFRLTVPPFLAERVLEEGGWD